MLYDPKNENPLTRLEAQLRRAETITSELMSDVMAVACVRLDALGRSAKSKISRLMEAGAWTDAALQLVALELPQWTLRRLVHDDGEWLCTLSRHAGLPLEYDEVAEASHEFLPLAILIALLVARRSSAATTAGVTTVPQVRLESGYPMCCDNFS